MARVLLCRKCGHWYQVALTVPDICPHCEQSASWTTDIGTYPDPAVPYVLSYQDKKFLRSLKIHVESEEDGA